MLRHTNFIIYYPQGNGQAEFINKVFGTLLTKLVIENRNDLDEHLSTILFSYRTTYKIGTSRTTFQLVYGIHSLLPTKYMLPYNPGENKDPQLVRVLTSRLFELKKYKRISGLHKIYLLPTNGKDHYGHNTSSLKPSFNLETMYYGFQTCSEISKTMVWAL
jgi:hypothetical protein